LASLPILALELIRDDLISLDRTFLDVMNILVLVAFAVDYVVELALASNRGSYVRHEWTSALIVVTQARVTAVTKQAQRSRRRENSGGPSCDLHRPATRRSVLTWQ